MPLLLPTYGDGNPEHSHHKNLHIISHKLAKDKGWARYYTGEPCDEGHYDERQTSNKTCNECRRIKQRAIGKLKPRRYKHKHLIKQDDGSYIAEPCRKCGCTRRNTQMKCVDCRHKYYQDNKAKIDDMKKEHRSRNYSQYQKKWRENYLNNKERYIHQANIQRAKKLMAMPNWLTRNQRSEIRSFYRYRPESMHVDHIVPLQGKLVCGLHVPWNLRYLDALENTKKHNHFPWDDETEKRSIGHNGALGV